MVTFFTGACHINKLGTSFIVPSKTLKSFFGRVLLREKFNEGLLKEKLGGLDLKENRSRLPIPGIGEKKNRDVDKNR